MIEIPYNLNNSEIKSFLLSMAKKNRKLTNFINRFFKKHGDERLSLIFDPKMEWDVECYGKGAECSEIALKTDFEYHICEDPSEVESGGWEMFQMPRIFSDYFTIVSEWHYVTLDNGYILLITDEDDHIAFNIVDFDNMVDGMVDMHNIKWHAKFYSKKYK